MAQNVLTKRVQIDQANTRLLIITGVATFIFIFSLVASKALISQAAYQNRVISAKKTAVAQLKTDITASAALKNSYQAFVGTTQNVIGGNSTGNGPKDGDNAQIILNALLVTTTSRHSRPALRKLRPAKM